MGDGRGGCCSIKVTRHLISVCIYRITAQKDVINFNYSATQFAICPGLTSRHIGGDRLSTHTYIASSDLNGIISGIVLCLTFSFNFSIKSVCYIFFIFDYWNLYTLISPRVLCFLYNNYINMCVNPRTCVIGTFGSLIEIIGVLLYVSKLL